MTPGRPPRTVAFVVARLTSSRLPQKQLRQIGPRSVIEWIMAALGTCAELDEVVLATVDEPGNLPLRDLAERRGWECFWYQGGVDDVVGRLTRAAGAYDADICLLISADCPLVHAPSVDELVRQMRALPDADCLVMPAAENGHVCLLEGVQIARRTAWDAADALSDRPELREHQFPALYRSPGRFQHVPVRLHPTVYGPHHRLSIDTWADLEFMQALHDRLSDLRAPFALPDAIRLLADSPEIKLLNAHVHQRVLVETVRRVLMIVDAGGAFGYGHFMRCRELAGQIVERLGWPVTLVLDDERALLLAQASGLPVVWGALGRAAGAPPAGTVEALDARALSAHDLVLVDISARRTLPGGWRAALAARVPVVVLDREDAVADEADLIVYPGVTGRAGSRDGKPPVVEGTAYAILRREVRHAMAVAGAKDIDLLVYLYDDDQRAQVDRWARARGWHIETVSGFDPQFADKLARSRIFLSGYGQSFYEAVALGTCPVAWPLSAAHAADARAFYAAFGLPALCVTSDAEFDRVLTPLLAGGIPDLPVLTDGTPAIVAKLAGLCT